MPKLSVFTGTFIHTPTLGALEILQDKAVGVDEDGVICFIVDCYKSDEDNEIRVIEKFLKKSYWRLKGSSDWEYVRKWSGKGVERWWFPGFVDTHIHASQHPNAGVFGKSTLLSWLHTYTFPLESSLSDQNKARTVYHHAVSRTLSHGTTTAAYYATTHVESTKILADICLQKGQRAFIGRCCMDSSINPAYYKDASADSAIRDTQTTLSHIASIDPSHNLINPILTPRFAPSCTPTLLFNLGHLAKEANIPIQTHISENTAEIELVKQFFPAQESYAHVYDHHGILTPKTVLAHGIHLSPSERALIKQRGSKISHCPVSNTSLSSGLCPVRELLDEGIEVGLGTDVSGGYSSSILVAAREAGMVSRTLAGLCPEDLRDGDKGWQEDGSGGGDGGGVEESGVSEKDWKKLSPKECLYLATMGGAKCLGLEGKVGAFEVGMEWDAQLVEVEKIGDGDDDDVEEGEAIGDDRGSVELWGDLSWADRIAKWVFCGDDRNTRKVYVKGKLVHER